MPYCKEGAKSDPSRFVNCCAIVFLRFSFDFLPQLAISVALTYYFSNRDCGDASARLQCGSAAMARFHLWNGFAMPMRTPAKDD